jgi:S-adenosyl-L-methionine hydrolase (adenosine-forming)
MTGARVITLLTDFGLDDPYVGVLKAVVLRHCPAVQIVDLSHSIAPYDRLGAAFWLERVFGWFPDGTVHVVVVDPGVGSTRRAVAVAAHRQVFVGPDNGVLNGVYASDVHAEAREMIPGALGLSSPSRTFHGRDVFAPVAARLAEGSLLFDGVGDRVVLSGEVLLPLVTESGGVWTGQVVTIDRFGNALTNLLEPPWPGTFEVCIAGRRVPLLGTYADAALGDVFALFGSFGSLELAMREGHAASQLGISRGALVELRRIT